jgi:hypothetical protein
MAMDYRLSPRPGEGDDRKPVLRLDFPTNGGRAE